MDERVVDCVEGACAPLKAAGVDTVILGCTHYPLVRPVLQRELGRGVAIVSSGEAIADEVEARAARGRASSTTRAAAASYRFLATGDPEDVPPRSARASSSCRSARCATSSVGRRPAGGGRREEPTAARRADELRDGHDRAGLHAHAPPARR